MIRVTFDDGTVADLPEETPADPFGEPGADETPMTLEQVRLDSTAAHVLIGGTWRGCLVETLGEEARRLRAERDAERARADAAEKKLADLRSWAEGQTMGASGDPVLRYLDVFSRVVTRIDGKETT